MEKDFHNQKRKKKKSKNRKSAAVDVAQEKELGKKNDNTKKPRPKSMPVATLAQSDEQEISDGGEPQSISTKPPADYSKNFKSKGNKQDSFEITDQDVQKATGPAESQLETKQAKIKKPKKKKGPTNNDTISAESPIDKKKKSIKSKQKSALSEQTFSSPSSPPEEEIRVPKQVTVGVVKKKKEKTRPLLEVSGSPRSKVYQTDPAQEDDEDNDADAEERELLHDMDTLQRMASEAAASRDKKTKGEKHGKLQDTQVEETKTAKKSKESKSKGKFTTEPEFASIPVEGLKESNCHEKQSKVAKKKNVKKGSTDWESEPTQKIQPILQPASVTNSAKKQSNNAKKVKGGGRSELEPRLQEMSEVEEKAPKKMRKSKGKGNVEGVPQEHLSPPPEATTQLDKKQAKKIKKSKSTEKCELELEPEETLPPQEEAQTEPSKKRSLRVKSKGKGEPEPEAPSPSLPSEDPKGGKKNKSKQAKGKENSYTTDTPKAAVLASSLEEFETPKKRKRKVSKASLGTPESLSTHNDGSSSTRSSRSRLSTKSSQSKIASEESDDLVWVGAEKSSIKSKSFEFKTKDDSMADEEWTEMNLSSSSRSTSYHELSKEDRKFFQEELRKASSQHSMDLPEAAEGNVKVEIDPNVKVTKSGVVKGGKGSRRPSLQVFGDGGIEQADFSSPSEGMCTVSLYN